jgi:altronate hydrolase
MGPEAVLLLHPDDNVAVALRDIVTGERIPVGPDVVLVHEQIPFGHKLARRQIASGEPVVKYGHPIGYAIADIGSGTWVHTHNLVTAKRVPAEAEDGTVGIREARP